MTMRLRELVGAARRMKTMDFEWTAEVCHWLLHNGGVNEDARPEVAKVVEKVAGSLDVKVEQWRGGASPRGASGRRLYKKA